MLWHGTSVSIVYSDRPPSIGQNLQPFTSNGNVSNWVKFREWDEKQHKTKNEQYHENSYNESDNKITSKKLNNVSEKNDSNL